MKKSPPPEAPQHPSLPEPPGGDSASGEVTLPLAEYLALLRGLRPDPPATSPYSLAVLRAAYVGEVLGRYARIEASLSVRVFREGWTPVHLFGAEAAIESVHLRTVAPVRSPDAGEDSGATVEAAAPAEATVVVRGDTYHLLAPAPGVYELEAVLLCALRGGGTGNALSLGVPRATSSTLSLAVPREGLEVQVQGALNTETRSDPRDGDARSVITAWLPPVNRLQVEWSHADAEAPERREVPPLLNGEVEQLVSIGEGLLRCRLKIRYELLQGAIGQFALSLPGEAVILGVEGQAIRSWASAEGDAPDAPQRLGVQLHYPVEGGHALDVTFQCGIPEGGAVEIPTAALLGVERQRGFIGIEARTNVEITTQSTQGVARVDIQELPRSLWNMADNPLLFGFKYLRVPVAIQVDVTKHDDVEVLVATIDAAFAEATLVEDGKVETRVTYLVRNNQKQFLRMELPDDSTVWSTFVSDNPVKPATDAERPGSLLISLEKSQVVQDLHRPFPVEVVYLTRIPELGRSGALDFVCPRVDVPINIMLVKLHLPDAWRYSKFDGSLKKVDRFSRAFYQRPSAAPGGARRQPVMSNIMRAQAPMQVQNAPQMLVDEEFDSVSDLLSEHAAEAPELPAPPPPAAQSRGFGVKSRGVLPVRVELPGHGRTFCFEKLLVIDEQPALSARYRKPWWRRGDG